MDVRTYVSLVVIYKSSTSTVSMIEKTARAVYSFLESHTAKARQPATAIAQPTTWAGGKSLRGWSGRAPRRLPRCCLVVGNKTELNILNIEEDIMYVCVYVWMNKCTVWRYVGRYTLCAYWFTYVRMYECMHVRMYTWMVENPLGYWFD